MIPHRSLAWVDGRLLPQIDRQWLSTAVRTHSYPRDIPRSWLGTKIEHKLQLLLLCARSRLDVAGYNLVWPIKPEVVNAHAR